jgi:hypothetical protein
MLATSGVETSVHRPPAAGDHLVEFLGILYIVILKEGYFGFSLKGLGLI